MNAITSTRLQCPLDPRCEYAPGHHGDCTSVEVAQHVLKLRENKRLAPATQRAVIRQAELTILLAQVEFNWFEALVQNSTEDNRSPLLIVGWVSERRDSSGYGKTIRAETWHRDRQCRRNRAMGYLVPVLYMETGRQGRNQVGLCQGCGQLTDDEKARVKADYAELRRVQLDVTEGLCWGGRQSYKRCGAPIEPGKMACPNHQAGLSEACCNNNHDACDGVLETKTRPDGSTYALKCDCWVCH